jgi:TolA-binding protein
MRINFEVPDEIYFKFRDYVGNGSMSETLRMFIQGLIFNNSNETKLNEQLTILNSDINSLDVERKTIEFQLKQIREKREKEENQKQQERDELFSFDPFAHIETGRGKINEISRTLYKIEKGKFIPDWATTRHPENPKEYALELLNNLLKKEKGDEQ